MVEIGDGILVHLSMMPVFVKTKSDATTQTTNTKNNCDAATQTTNTKNTPPPSTKIYPGDFFKSDVWKNAVLEDDDDFELDI